MRRLVQLLVIGSALAIIVPGIAVSPGLQPMSVEAAPALAFVAGTVRDEGGQPLTGAVVALLEATFNGREIKSVKTDSDGKFLASVMPGAYRLRAAADGFKPVLARVLLDRAAKLNYDFALKREDTLVEKRGDSDDYRWIGRSVPRHILHLDEAGEVRTNQDAAIEVSNKEFRPYFRGMVQLLSVNSFASRVGREPAFYGTNFAIAGSFGGNFEMAVIGQRGSGMLAPQRVEAIATMRPWNSHQITASVGYGQMPFAKRMIGEIEGIIDVDPGAGAGPQPVQHLVQNASTGAMPNRLPVSRRRAGTIDQLSLSAVGQWQVFQPLLVIYGFDYARFVGSTSSQRESILPRLAFQFSPSERLRLNAAVTPGASRSRLAPEAFGTEDLQASFETQAPEFGFVNEPMLDRSRRFEFGFERIFGDGSSSVEVSAFYDVVAGHGIGVLALPLEASEQTQAAFRQVASQVESMRGAARGVRVMYARHLGNQVTASFGYSFGRGSRLNDANLNDLRPADLLRNGFFHVATAKLDLDFSEQTGTRVSTVVRLSPDAVVFAIDPFAGQMSVYDPNINIYVTQELPNLGLPFRWEALIDIRNLLNQLNGVDDGSVQLASSRSYRTVRGGLAFRW